jgi:hypothetical protein
MRFKFFLLTSVLWYSLTEANAQTVDVDLYTGQPVVQIPIWTIRSGELSQPIGVTFSSSGVKTGLSVIRQLGMGWNYVFTGSIAREIRGFPDELVHITSQTSRYGWLHENSAEETGHFLPSADDDLSDCSDEESDFDFLNSRGGFSTTGIIKDTEPDIFTVNAPGLSCKFVFDHNGQIKTISGSDLKISYTDKALTGFTIITDMGIEYSFEVTELGSIHSTDNGDISFLKREYYSYRAYIPYKRGWRLSKITAPTGDYIKYDYKPNNIPSIVGSDYLSLPHVFNKSIAYRKLSETESYSKQSMYSLEQTINLPPIPYRITTRNERVDIEINDFLFPAGLYDPEHPNVSFNIYQPIVTGIRVTATNDEKEELLRLINFEYVPTHEVAMGEYESQEKNLFLRSISNNTTLTSFQRIVFEYAGITFTNNHVLNYGAIEADLKSEDEFGYHNDIQLRIGSPYQVHIYPHLAGTDRFRMQPIAGYSSDYFSAGNAVSSYAYKADGKSLQIGMLSGIRHADGSINRIFYEPNTYYDSLSGISVYGGGVRVKRTELHDGISHANDIIKNYDYVKSNGQSSGVLVYRPERNFNLHFYQPTTGNAQYFEDMEGLDVKSKWKRLSRLTYHVLNDDSNPGMYVAYKQVNVQQAGAGKTVFEFSVPLRYGTLQHGNWQATRTRVARKSPSEATLISCSQLTPLGTHYAYPFAPNPNYDYQQGLLTTVTHFNEAGHPVERTENEFSLVTNPEKIYGIRMDKFQSPITVTVLLEGNPVTRQTVTDMFLYSRYEIHVGARTRLTSVRNYKYDKNNPAAFVLEEKQFEYGSTNHHYLTHTRQTNSDGVEHHTALKYPDDYTITASYTEQDNHTQALTHMKLKNMRSLPVETISWRKQGSTETISGGNLMLFDYQAQQDRIDLVKTLSLTPGKAKSSFTFAYVANSGNAAVFTFDNGYIRYTKFSDHNTYGRVRSTRQYNKSKSGVHYNANGTARAGISNAVASEVVFSDFEFSGEFDFTHNANPVFENGRITGRALKLYSGAAYKLTAQTQKGDNNKHVFSCWTKSVTAVTLTVHVSSDGQPTQTISIAVPDTEGQWRYVQGEIPTSSFGNELTIEVETNGTVLIDDAAFYPKHATIVHYLYDGKLNKVAETSNELSTTFEYDPVGRLTIVRDNDSNIIKNFTYGVYESALENIGLAIMNKDGNKAFANEPTTFTAHWFDAPGVIYKWKLVTWENRDNAFDFSDAVVITGNNTWTHNFTQVGSWLLTLEVTYGNLTKRISKEITVKHRPLNVTLCANRPTLIDICNLGVFNNSCNPSQSSGLTLSASVSNGVGALSYQWRYQVISGGVILGEYLMPQTGSSVTISDFVQGRMYYVSVTDSNSAMGYAELLFKVYQSNPECLTPDEN